MARLEPRGGRGRARATASRAATDVTGFGLVGHAAAIARESRLTLEIELDALPLLPGALELARAHPGRRPQGEPRASSSRMVEYGGRAEEARRALLYDPQTSGGLLLLVPEPRRPTRCSRSSRARASSAGRAAPARGPIVVRS